MAKCEFCNQNEADKLSVYAVEMYKVVSRQTVQNTRTPKFKTQIINIQRCAACRKEQEKLLFRQFIGLLLSFALGLFWVILVITLAIKNEFFPEKAVRVIFIALIGVIVPSLLAFIMTTSEKRLLSQFESVNSLFMDGWIIGEPEP